MESHKQQRSGWQKAGRLLLPLDNSVQEIRALDGLRAVAALSVVLYHVFLAGSWVSTAWGSATREEFYFLETGVQLFFVLSGFLLFLPYARALLSSQPLPRALRFYQRRALRILPAYWVCLTLLVLLVPWTFGGPKFLGDVLSHVVLIHDDFPPFNRDIEGPFWTLAVEVQFYLALPLLAAVLQRVMGASRSLVRLSAAVVTIMVLALMMRALDAEIMAHLPVASMTGIANVGQVFVLITMGTQGKYLEVFAVGMLCAVLYVATIESKLLSVKQQHRLGLALLIMAIVLILVSLPLWPYFSLVYHRGFDIGIRGVVTPFIVSLGYGSLLLAILWGNAIIRAPFEFYPLRFIGLISFSLYLWHDPFISHLIPGLARLSLVKVRIPLAFIAGYLSYQLVERPFLTRRKAIPREYAQPITSEPYPRRVEQSVAKHASMASIEGRDP